MVARKTSRGACPFDKEIILTESERGEGKSWLKTQHSKNKDPGIWSHHFMANSWRNNGNSDRLYFYQCTSPEHPVSCIEPGLAICFTYDNIHVSMLFSQIILPSPSPTESKRLFYTSVSLLMSRIQRYHYHLCKFHIVALVYYQFVYCQLVYYQKPTVS